MNPKSNRSSKSAKRQEALGVMTRVLRLRIKDKHAGLMRTQAMEVNQVWNYSQDLALQCLRREQRFMSAYDMAPYTKGAAKEGMSLHSQTIQAVSEEYCTRRKQFKCSKLRWRVSRGSRRSLGWIPFKASAIGYKNGQLLYQGKPISLWDSYGLKDYALRSGSFSEDARGRWYVNITVDAKKPEPSAGKSAVGIDLGLKDLAALSTGETVEAQRFYRDLEPALATAQRACKKGRTQAIHAKIANRRKDHLHKLSTRLVASHGAIFVGNVNSSSLVKTNMAKSVLDSGWTMFRSMLQYKGDCAGSMVREVNEAYSTQECSGCGSRTGPKGLEGLAVRHWMCSACGAVHNRDVNAAINIRDKGLAELEEEFAIKGEVKADEALVNEGANAPAAGHGRPVGEIPVLTAQAAAVG